MNQQLIGLRVPVIYNPDAVDQTGNLHEVHLGIIREPVIAHTLKHKRGEYQMILAIC